MDRRWGRGLDPGRGLRDRLDVPQGQLRRLLDDGPPWCARPIARLSISKWRHFLPRCGYGADVVLGVVLAVKLAETLQQGSNASRYQSPSRSLLKTGTCHQPIQRGPMDDLDCEAEVPLTHGPGPERLARCMEAALLLSGVRVQPQIGSVQVDFRFGTTSAPRCG